MKLFLPVQRLEVTSEKKIFLAGTIDNGKSADWQQKAISLLEDTPYHVYNPRRERWNPDWEQTYENSEFFQQVMWENDALKKADVIVMHFSPGSLSPITLLELGLFASSGKIKMHCPKEFWRRGNVEITCSMHNIPMYETIEELIKSI